MYLNLSIVTSKLLNVFVRILCMVTKCLHIMISFDAIFHTKNFHVSNRQKTL